jgi:hypothetical protein
MKKVTEENENSVTGRVNKGGRPKKSQHLDQKIRVLI